MKKIIVLLNVLVLTTVLTACAGVIEYDPITVDGFEVAVETNLIIDQGEYELSEDELMELLPELFTEVGIDEENTEETDLVLDIEVPETAFTFLLELAEYELYHEGVDEAEDFELPIDSMELITASGETASFDDIEFTDAGTYTFRITQAMSETVENEVDESDYETDINEDEDENNNWTLDETAHYITVAVTEDVENEVLIATVSSEEIIFVNEYTYSIEEQITEAIQELERLELEAWEERVADAYADGYELTLDENGNEVLTAIYVPEPVVEAPTHPYQPATGANNHGSNVPAQTPNGNNNNTASAPAQQTPPTPRPVTPTPQEPANPPSFPSNGENCEFVKVAGGYIWGNDGEGNPSSQTYYTYEWVCN